MATILTAATVATCAGAPTVQVIDNRGLATRGLQYSRRVAGEAVEQLMTRNATRPQGN